MGNTVGSSLNGFFCAWDYYILGLWLADGYWRSGSVGLTSTNDYLIGRFESFLKKAAPQHTIKKRFYWPGSGKRRLKATQIYVNSRGLTRTFLTKKKGELFVPPSFLPAYLAGRIDGDGHVDYKHRTGIRIVYGTRFDAERDQNLIGVKNAGLYQYTAARTYVLYFYKKYRQTIWPLLTQYSLKCNPVETESV
jgi:hypothetical protein